MPPKKNNKSSSKAADKKVAAPVKDDGKKSSADGHRNSTGVLESRPRALDVKIGGFSMTAYGKELIKDTSIELTIGRRYGLIGSNGSGKSQFLQCLAEREVPIPEHIDMFLLENEAPPLDMTGVEYIVDEAVKEKERLEQQADEILDEQGAESELLMDIYNRLESMEPETFEMRAAKLLHGLGFNADFMAKKTKDLSGGWRMRVSLAKALFVRPTILLLDEPTNHLDLEACVWLENYLADYDRCLIIVSHSQDFLNNVCTHTIHITEKGQLKYYTGNYDQFVKTKEELEVNQMKRYEKEQADIAHIHKFVASAGTYANLVRQAKSKLKIIEKMKEAGLTEKVVKQSGFCFKFTNPEALPPPVVTFHDVTFAYSGDLNDALYKNLNLGVDMDSRIALVGPNGAGKSTLLKLIYGDLQPTEGQIRRHLKLEMGRYHQHSNETLDNNKNVMDFVRDSFPDMKKDENEWRAILGRYGISGARQTQIIGTLSDGMKTRIVFCMLALRVPHILLLDEPTNHLDMESIDALAEAINSFSGGVLLVSHDFRLIDQVAQTIWVCDNKTVDIWKGDIRSYKKSLTKKMEANERERQLSKFKVISI